MDGQLIGTLIVVGLAGAYLLQRGWKTWRGLRGGGCSGDCGCAETRPANEAKTLIIDKIVMHQTPQVATWFVCFEARTDGAMQRYRVPNQSFDKDGVTIQMDLKVPNVRPGQTCTFKCQLDDVEDDVCTDEIDNTSSGKFTVTESGSQEYKPEDRWRYTISWHLK